MASNDGTANNSLFGVGSWMRKKRYEDEDFSLSPPSDDPGIFYYHFGSTPKIPKPTGSMYDKINKELNLTVETPKREVTPERFDLGSSNLNSSLSFGGSRVPRDSKHHSNIPLFHEDGSRIVIPATILEKRESLNQAELTQEIALDILKNRPEFSKVAFEDAETLIKKAKPGRPTRKISMNLAPTIDRSALISSFEHLNVDCNKTSDDRDQELDSPVNSEDTRRKRRSVSPVIQSPFISSLSVPAGIKERRRKLSAPPNLNPMDRTSNFFFTGGLFSSVQTSTASTMCSSEAPHSVVASTLPAALDLHQSSSHSQPVSPSKQLEQSSLTDSTAKMHQKEQLSADLEPKPRMGKRRPKPSALREMNFWAPQST